VEEHIKKIEKKKEGQKRRKEEGSIE